MIPLPKASIWRSDQPRGVDRPLCSLTLPQLPCALSIGQQSATTFSLIWKHADLLPNSTGLILSGTWSWMSPLSNSIIFTLSKDRNALTVWRLTTQTPNDPYMRRTAPLISKRCILYIYSTNIGTEYFKHALYSPFFFSSKCSLFHNANLFGSCIIHILYTGVLKLKKKIPAQKG